MKDIDKFIYIHIQKETQNYILSNILFKKKILTYNTKIKLHDKMHFAMYKNGTEHKQKNMY